MIISTEHLRQCIKTLRVSYEMLTQTSPDRIEYEIFRNAVVKGFELTLETSGKLLRRAIKQYTGMPRAIDGLVFKEVFREGLQHGLIDNPETVERWFSYRDNRNNTAHDYGIGFAEETLHLVPELLNDADTLEKALMEKFGAKS